MARSISARMVGRGGKPLKYPALKPPDAGGYFRFHKLGEGYSLDEIKERILHNDLPGTLGDTVT